MSSKIIAGTTAGTALNMSADTSGILEIQTGSTPTTAITVDASQNVGIGGTTPSAWSLLKAVQIQNASFAGFGNTAYVGSNVYFDGSNFKYISTAASTLYTLSNSAGQHQWSTAASGTAGTNITYNQAMTLDSSGNLLVGTTNAGGRTATIVNTSWYTTTTAAGANMVVASDGTVYRSTSALKYKQDVRDLESIDINKFRPVRYKSNAEFDDQNKDYFGVIADEVDEAGIKELVNYGADGEVEGFQYERLTVVLLKAIQELNAKVDAQAAEIQALKGVAP